MNRARKRLREKRRIGSGRSARAFRARVPLTRRAGPTWRPSSLARDAADTADQWSEVREQWRSVEHVPNTAWARCTWRRRWFGGDRSAAAEPLLEAWEIADRLGALPLRDRAVDLAARARIPIEHRHRRIRGDRWVG